MSKRKAEASPPSIPEAGGDSANLDGQYRTIGISAVAAALPYSGEARNPAYAGPAGDRDKHGRNSSRKRSVLSV
jgi:hypothetical protein